MQHRCPHWVPLKMAGLKKFNRGKIIFSTSKKHFCKDWEEVIEEFQWHVMPSVHVSLMQHEMRG